MGVDLLGLTNCVALSYLPQKLGGLHLVLALPVSQLEGHVNIKICIRSTENPEQFGTCDLNMVVDVIKRASEDDEPIKMKPHGNVPIWGSQVWQPAGDTEKQAYSVFGVPCPPILLLQPDNVRVSMEIDEDIYELGYFSVGCISPQPMLDSEIKAIKSRPNAMGAIRFNIGCKKCDQKVVLVKTIDGERPRKLPETDYIMLEYAPDQWRCKCGSTEVDLRYAKIGIHDVFRRPPSSNQELDFVRLYEERALDSCLASYYELINSEPSEQEVQRFLENNTVFWGYLSPSRIIVQPPILTEFRADFGILSTNKVLYLIEIEKPSTQLAKRRGGMSAELQTPIDQIRAWRILVDDHRTAVVEQMGLSADQVHAIKFMIVAGLSKNTESRELKKIRRETSDIDFRCFDELGSYVSSTIDELAKL